MTEKRIKCELIEGGWIGDNKPQTFSIICYDIHKQQKHFFSFKCIGEYDKHNTKELNKLTEFIDHLLKENKQLKDEKNIEKGMKLIELTEKRFKQVVDGVKDTRTGRTLTHPLEFTLKLNEINTLYDYVFDRNEKLEKENEQLKQRLKLNCPEIVWRDLE